jgi:hypothetical protein
MQAEIAPAELESRTAYPPGIAEFYALIDWVHWTEYGGAGGLERGGVHCQVSERSYPLQDEIAAKDLTIWGSTPCGDIYIYTHDNRGGMLSHENGHLHFLGSVAESIDWIFNKLTKQELPDFDYGWMKRQ